MVQLFQFIVVTYRFQEADRNISTFCEVSLLIASVWFVPSGVRKLEVVGKAGDFQYFGFYIFPAWVNGPLFTVTVCLLCFRNTLTYLLTYILTYLKPCDSIFIPSPAYFTLPSGCLSACLFNYHTPKSLTSSSTSYTCNIYVQHMSASLFFTTVFLSSCRMHRRWQHWMLP